MKIKAICVECNKSFLTERRYLNRGHGRFCSLKCAGVFGNKIKSPTGQIVRCINCGKQIYRVRKQINVRSHYFCNRDCKAKYESLLHNGIERIKRKGTQKRAHLEQKKLLIDKCGIICQFPNCVNKLYNDRELIDMHHFGHSLDNSDTILFCTYHHRLADKGYLIINDEKIRLNNEKINKRTKYRKV